MQIAHIVEDNGGSLVAVHGRTRHQGYTGEADWDAIAEVRQALTIPVIGNGDVRSVADIERMKAHTGCPAVMIGRAAIGNPWIFARLERDQVTDEQVRQMVQRHLERMLSFYGDERGLLIFRKHASRYLKAWNLPREQRLQLFTTATAGDFVEFVAALTK
jgi:tRNA-dihydrouridine synthase